MCLLMHNNGTLNAFKVHTGSRHMSSLSRGGRREEEAGGRRKKEEGGGRRSRGGRMAVEEKWSSYHSSKLYDRECFSFWICFSVLCLWDG